MKETENWETTTTARKNTKYYIILVCTQINNTKYRNQKRNEKNCRQKFVARRSSHSFRSHSSQRFLPEPQHVLNSISDSATPSSSLCLCIGSTKSKEMFKPAKNTHTHRHTKTRAQILCEPETPLSSSPGFSSNWSWDTKKHVFVFASPKRKIDLQKTQKKK